ncbi:MAG: pyruvate kinase [Bacteroidetes bacterium]|nr:MAG: pyruvate kinase [Bacteroidota bacterium]
MTYSRTKIMATVGPACNNKNTLKKMILEGVNLFRLNFSHGTHDEHLKLIEFIRELNNELNTHIAILADLQGPKIRIGDVENNSVNLIAGESIEIVTSKCLSTADKLYIAYPEFPRDVKHGDKILIDDGKIMLTVEKTDDFKSVKAKILYGGVLSSKKGVNLPNTKISQPSLTEKDLSDAQFALSHKVDWIALSFVRSPQDMLDLREIVNKISPDTRMIAKIEKPEALDHLDEIIQASHGIMIARGDLGVEVSFSKLPMIQKNIIQKCINHGKPVVIATQMMESMITNFRPTRAETNDVANAVLDGADCLMLSGETSVGNFPVKVIANMKQIVNWTEEHGFTYIRENSPKPSSKHFLPDTICNHASQMAELSQTSAIISFTHSGYTTARIASHRPSANIFAFSNNNKILNSLSIVWGVRQYYLKTYQNINQAIDQATKILKEDGMIKNGEVVIHLGSIPLNMRGQTNMIKISYIN